MTVHEEHPAAVTGSETSCASLPVQAAGPQRVRIAERISTILPAAERAAALFAAGQAITSTGCELHQPESTTVSREEPNTAPSPPVAESETEPQRAAVRAFAHFAKPEAQVVIVEGPSRAPGVQRSRFATSPDASASGRRPAWRSGFTAAGHAAYRGTAEEASVDIVDAGGEPGREGSDRRPRGD